DQPVDALQVHADGGGGGGRGRGGGRRLRRRRRDRHGGRRRRRFVGRDGGGPDRRGRRIGLGRRQQGGDVDVVPGGRRRGEVGQRRQLVRRRSLSRDRFDAQVAVALDEVEDLAHRGLVRRGVEPDGPDQFVLVGPQLIQQGHGAFVQLDLQRAEAAEFAQQQSGLVGVGVHAPVGAEDDAPAVGHGRQVRRGQVERGKFE